MLSLNSVQDLDRWIQHQKRQNRFDASDAERKLNQCVWWNGWLIRACGDQYFVKTAPYGCVPRQQAAEVAPWVVDELKIRMSPPTVITDNEIRELLAYSAAESPLVSELEALKECEKLPNYGKEVVKLGFARLVRDGSGSSCDHVWTAIMALPDGEWNITAMRVK